MIKTTVRPLAQSPKWPRAAVDLFPAVRGLFIPAMARQRRSFQQQQEEFVQRLQRALSDGRIRTAVKNI